MSVLIRPERSVDEPDTFEVNRLAFPTPFEAELVNRLRTAVTAERGPWISLVAEDAQAIVGHILFTEVILSRDGEDVGRAWGLAPMAVRPEGQRRGVGSALVRAGLERCRDSDLGAVFVLGHPEYYPRFGFQPTEAFGIRWEQNVPPEVFMGVELVEGTLAAWRGAEVRYRPEITDAD